MTALLERLRDSVGTRSSRIAIITLRDLGMTQAANAGVFEVLQSGLAASASLAMTCPWARDASLRYEPQHDIGVQLTVNAQHAVYRWGPLTHAPSLLDGNGGLPMTPEDLWEHADLDEVRRECKAQIERAMSWGFDVSHLVSHLEALTLRPEFFDVMVDLAVEFNLPVSLPAAETSARAGFPLRELAAEEGIVFPDHTVDLMHDSPTTESVEAALAVLSPGVTEIRFAPAIDSPEVRALSPGWAAEVAQYRTLLHPAAIIAAAEESGVALATFRDLRKAQRS